jgi:hypothetical protein
VAWRGVKNRGQGEKKPGMIDMGSFMRGVRAIKRPYIKPTPKWGIRFSLKPKFWCDLWTPSWHGGRGAYMSVGLGFMAIYRGY